MVRSPRIGARDEVVWINVAIRVGLTIISAIPPGFAQYTTIVVPDDDVERNRADTGR